VKRWWNAKRGEVTVADIDLRVGGKWRNVMVTPEGFEVASTVSTARCPGRTHRDDRGL